MTEAEIQAEVMLQVGSRPDCRIWRSNTGSAKSRDGKRFVRFGLKGTSDLLGVLRVESGPALDALARLAQTARRIEDVEIIRRALQPLGRLVAIEVKSAAGRLTAEQQVFRRVIEAFGGLYILARSVADAVNAVEAACR